MPVKKPRRAKVPSAKAFGTVAEFRAWLETHHKTVPELILRCFKNDARHKGIGYFDALDEALAFGWIDGVRRRLDEVSYTVRFTPRRPRSKWSAVNIRRVAVLQAEGRMRPAGLAAFEARQDAHPVAYSYESKRRSLDPEFVRKFRSNARAWQFYEGQAPWYRRITGFWVMSAKRDETRARRLDVLIDCSARGKGIPPVEGKVRPLPRARPRRKKR